MDWLDKAMAVATGVKGENGRTSMDMLHEAGGRAYPGEDNSRNQGGHRLASKLMTDRMGPMVSQLAGVANEGLEAVNRKAVTGEAFGPGVWEDTKGDLAANWRGMKDSVMASALLRALGFGPRADSKGPELTPAQEKEPWLVSQGTKYEVPRHTPDKPVSPNLNQSSEDLDALVAEITKQKQKAAAAGGQPIPR